jgi:hypothetical protein
MPRQRPFCGDTIKGTLYWRDATKELTARHVELSDFNQNWYGAQVVITVTYIEIPLARALVHEFFQA